jgi:ABC-type oligopeptide transport system substrate-binding subunit
MPEPKSLKEIAARAILANQIQIDGLPRELLDYLVALQGSNLDMIEGITDRFNRLWEEFETYAALDTSSAEPYVIEGYAQPTFDKLMELDADAKKARDALSTDLYIVQSEGSSEWQAYAVPLLTSEITEFNDLINFMADVIDELGKLIQH